MSDILYQFKIYCTVFIVLFSGPIELFRNNNVLYRNCTVHIVIVMVTVVCSFAHEQAGVKHVILAVSYRAELLEKEMREQEERVSIIM